MRLGMTLGLIGGVIALLFGLVLALIGNAVGGAASQLGATETATRGFVMMVVSLGLPVMAIVGAIILPKNTGLAALLMAVSGGAIAIFGASSQAWVFAAVGGLIVAGAFFGWQAAQAETDEASPQ